MNLIESHYELITAEANLNIATASIVGGNTFTLANSPTMSFAEAVYLAAAANTAVTLAEMI